MRIEVEKEIGYGTDRTTAVIPKELLLVLWDVVLKNLVQLHLVLEVQQIELILVPHRIVVNGPVVPPDNGNLWVRFVPPNDYTQV